LTGLSLPSGTRNGHEYAMSALIFAAPLQAGIDGRIFKALAQGLVKRGRLREPARSLAF